MSELRSIKKMSMNPARYIGGGRSDSLLLLARACMAVVFIFSGAGKLLGWQSAVIEFEQLGVPLPGTVFTFVATLVGHRFWDHEGAEFHRQLTTALEHLAIVGGFLLLMITGPGRLSFRAKREG